VITSPQHQEIAVYYEEKSAEDSELEGVMEEMEEGPQTSENRVTEVVQSVPATSLLLSTLSPKLPLSVL